MKDIPQTVKKKKKTTTRFHGSYILVYVRDTQGKESMKVQSSHGLQPQGGGEAGDKKGCSEKVHLRGDMKEGGV